MHHNHPYPFHGSNYSYEEHGKWVGQRTHDIFCKQVDAFEECVEDESLPTFTFTYTNSANEKKEKTYRFELADTFRLPGEARMLQEMPAKQRASEELKRLGITQTPLLTIRPLPQPKAKCTDSNKNKTPPSEKENNTTKKTSRPRRQKRNLTATETEPPKKRRKSQRTRKRKATASEIGNETPKENYESIFECHQNLESKLASLHLKLDTALQTSLLFLFSISAMTLMHGRRIKHLRGTEVMKQQP